MIPDELMTKPFAEWQLDLLTLFVLAQVIGRAYTALRKGGGLVGLWRGIMFGTNTPGPAHNPAPDIPETKP